MSFEDYLAETIGDKKMKARKSAPTAKRSAEEIMAELMPLVELDQKKGG